MTTLFGQHRRLRRIAAQVLLAWLFTLTVGIVNACVLAPEPGRENLTAAHDEHLAAAAQVSHETHAAGTHEHRSPHGDKAACEKACNEPSTGAQTLKQKIDPFTAIWLAPAPADAQVTLAVASIAGTPATGLDPGPTAVPIRIAFQRLIL